MKKYIIIFILFITAVIFVLINLQEIFNILKDKQLDNKIESYFPIQQNIKYIYEVNEQGLFYQVTPDYTSEDMIQLRVKGNEDVIISLI